MLADSGDDSRALVSIQPAAPAPDAPLAERSDETPALETPAPAPARAGQRRALVLAAIGGAVVAVAYALAPNDDDTDLAARGQAGGYGAAPPRSRTPAKPAPVALGAPARDPLPVQPAGDPFVQVSFVPPPPPAPAAPPPPPPAPPPAPKAPPLPFSFVGLLEKGGPKPAAFLARGDALLVVSAGDVIDKDYRIETLSAREIVVTYLPLNERQTLTATGGRP